MIENDLGRITICHPSGWEADHDDERFGGPFEIRLGDEVLAQTTSFLLDDVPPDSVVLKKCRAYRKGGIAIAVCKGYLPFGNQIKFAQTCRYAANHARITFDVNWPRAAPVRSHFRIGDLFLPGEWSRFWCLDGTSGTGQWQDIGQDDTIASWGTPPLALVFEREDGLRFELGVGSDIWRWQAGMTLPLAENSFRVVREANGVRLIQELVTAAEEVEPQKRQYRFSWYLAWSADLELCDPPSEPVPLTIDLKDGAHLEKLSDEDIPCVALDLAALPLPSHCLRTSDGLPCWQSPGTQKLARRVVRQLAGRFPEGHLVVRNPTVGSCTNTSHFDRKGGIEMTHWDLPPLMDFSEWACHCLGDGWDISAEFSNEVEQPSLAGLFTNNGFRADTAEDE
ncbi:MAG: hypothetical protein KAI66_13425 [Lentisphaeria bacterium]|nr:hypothetical protein [Lentisphaeria bacterium]